MVKSTGVRKSLMAEAPPGIAALVIAELFFKLGSFTAECLAFLATWYLLSLGYSAFKRLLFKTA